MILFKEVSAFLDESFSKILSNQQFLNLDAEKTAFRTVILYGKLIEKIERITMINEFTLTKLSVVAAILPSALITLVNYFVYDLRDESYQLPFPVM